MIDGRHAFLFACSDLVDGDGDLAGLVFNEESSVAVEEEVKIAGKTFQQNTNVRSQISTKWRDSRLSDRD